MILTPKKQQRIYEEEKIRRSVPTPTSPTDLLSSCILGCAAFIGILLLLGFLSLLAIALFYPNHA